MKAKIRPRDERQKQCPDTGWRRTAYIIIFESDTRLGKLFDILLLILILASILTVALETVPQYAANKTAMRVFWNLEWVFTALFTLEYVIRVACLKRPWRYIFSFWGLIDVFAFMPSYLVLLGGPRMGTFTMIRSIRLLRVFRVLKLLRMMSDADELYRSVWESRNKIVVFLFVVLIAVTLSGTLMYQVENADWEGDGKVESGFTSIPQSMYWAVITMTTVGYGDVVPQTTAGKSISAMLILLGYSLIIVPTGFVTAKLARQATQDRLVNCSRCHRDHHASDARYCNQCGSILNLPATTAK